jgi:hypothetical protein
VADLVMRMPEPYTREETSVSERSQGIHIQRACTECGEELRRQPLDEEEEEEEEILQAKEASGRTLQVAPNLVGQIDGLRGRSQPLPRPVRAFFEPRFGCDLSQVRVHTDTRAAETARWVNARAFAIGNSVVFARGQYNPQSKEGQRLIAHELAHVIQQRTHHIQALMRTCDCNAHAGGRNPDSDEETTLEGDFPHAMRGQYCMIGEGHYTHVMPPEVQARLAAYNCFARVVGLPENMRTARDFYRHIGDPEAAQQVHEDAPLTHDLLRRFFAVYGLRPVTSPYYADVVVYARDSLPEHAARRTSVMCGGEYMYESKLGTGMRIAHMADQLEGGLYGSIVAGYIWTSTRLPRRSRYPTMIPYHEPRFPR